MKKKIFTVLLCLSAIVGVSFAQRPKVSKKKSKAPITFFQTKEDSLAATYEHLALSRGEFLTSAIEQIIIPKGGSTHIKYRFDNRYIYRIVVEDTGEEATAEDIKNGVWIATVSPERTKWIKVNVYERRTIGQYTGNPQIKESINESGYRVIVVDPAKYDSIMTEYKKVENDYEKHRNFTNKLAGGTWKDFKTGKIK